MIPRCILPGLSITGDTPAARRAALAALPDAAVAERLAALAHDMRARRDELDAVASIVRAPFPEVAASPFGARACAMAAARGAALVHHDLRVLEPFEPGDDAIDDAMHGIWELGVLHVGKYRAFTQDEPFATFNPNHMAKWTPHELLHRVAGFVWRPDITRWELYLSARLNELVPVVLWYGPDEAFRGDASGFDRAHAARHPHVDRSDIAWLDADADELDALAMRSVAHLRRSLAHLERELAAVDRELHIARPVPTPADGLDASSDALAYVVGHADRLASRAFERLFERGMIEHDHFVTDVFTFRDHVERIFDTLLFGDIDLDVDLALARRDARSCLDIAHRVASQGWRAVRGIVPLLAELREATADIEQGVPFDVGHWRVRLADALDPDVAAIAFATGAPPPSSAPPASIAQLDDGLAGCVPATRRWYARHTRAGEDELARVLASSSSLWRRAPLAARVVHLLDDIGAPRALVELARLEQRIIDGWVDDHVERICEAVADGEGTICVSTAFSLMPFEHDVLSLHADAVETLAEVDEPSALLVGTWDGGVSILPAPAAIADWWRHMVDIQHADRTKALAHLGAALQQDPPPADLPQTADAWLGELLDAGALGFVPAPRISGG